MKYETGIQIPTITGKGRPNGLTVWEKMSVGTSVFLHEDGRKKCTAASNWGSRQTPKQRFSMRSMDGGFRIWRIE